MSKKERNLAIGAVIGAGVGYLAGILTAKQSGKETREDIAKSAINAKNQAEKTIKSLHTTLADLVAQAEKVLVDTKAASKDGLSKAIDAAKLAKDHAREVLSAIHEGDADDADLKKAISDANKAIDHLKDYLNKVKN